MILSAENLSKSYGAVKALKNFGLEVAAGSVYGVLGPNGSGKTTLLGILLGILRADTGWFRWSAGRIGTLLETPNFYPYLSGPANLSITAEIRGSGHDQIRAVLRRVGLESAGKLAFGKYSLGMKQRLAIGAALLGDPGVLVLDEPTNGLDPSGIAEVRDLLRGLAAEGRTVILASHLLDEVEKVCTHVAILKSGVLLQSGLLSQVLREDDVFEVRAEDVAGLEAVLQSLGMLVERSVEGFVAHAPAGQVDAALLNRACFDKGVVLQHLVQRRQTLESKFLELTA